ncbi:glycosyltransferase family 2 protein [Prevotella melaninogenica]|uniref:glycosyltransferase family 2 protein n=1 Tax=Prevotella melaninogenica TaxID=28132 RepID=UPI001C5E284F|nr:glycosyltransferase family A protein [Prevotella melaninogenica]MBW4729320.1 glycosyltransferase family 2 protein [Prevotella melaninogenica]MBW4731976.1 glycosyltransferase family 2 protein [Prevotella melaninogenica]MBW4749837.1 glycosyltransferase family 2 protein [Prevotella melaninogenica]
MPFISILTPTYNRGKLLLPLYESLKNLTFEDFEWLIVDDGSEDDTEQYALSWISYNIQKAEFPIRYIKKSNGGKHTAINRGVREANGELILILDSDDTLPEDSLATIAQYYEQCKGYKDCAGVCGLMSHHDGQLIGTGFPKDPMYESALQFRYAEKSNVTGDLLEIYKTSVMREFPFPEIENEKFCPESLVWNRIANKYKLFCFNKVVYYRDYLEGGLTSKIVRIRMNSPIASTMTYAEMLDYNISLKWKIRSAINYWRFKYCITNKSLKAPAVKWYWKVFQIIGLIMHLKDNR